MNAFTEKYAVVRAVNGGYIVETTEGSTVCTSLQKAMSMVKATIAPVTETTESEQLNG